MNDSTVIDDVTNSICVLKRPISLSLSSIFSLNDIDYSTIDSEYFRKKCMPEHRLRWRFRVSTGGINHMCDMECCSKKTSCYEMFEILNFEMYQEYRNPVEELRTMKRVRRFFKNILKFESVLGLSRSGQERYDGFFFLFWNREN